MPEARFPETRAALRRLRISWLEYRIASASLAEVNARVRRLELTYRLILMKGRAGE